MRKGQLTPEAIKSFRSLSRALELSDVVPTELFPLRKEVERANAARLSAIHTPSYPFVARDSGPPTEQRAKLLAAMMAVERLELKVGAQVMLIKNMDEKLVNGSVGRVLGFHPASSAVSGDKMKGGLIRNVLMEKDGITPMMVKDENVPEEREKKPLDDKKTVHDREGSVKVSKADELLPLVRFLTPTGTETVLFAREEFRTEDNEGKVLARRMQVWQHHKTENMTHLLTIFRFHLFSPGQCQFINPKAKRFNA